jgi:hypothetical protein
MIMPQTVHAYKSTEFGAKHVARLSKGQSKGKRNCDAAHLTRANDNYYIFICYYLFYYRILQNRV